MICASKRKICCTVLGDGANDVPMICSAHVGIGIVGKEGLEAARSADFGIRNFRYGSLLNFSQQ